MSARGLVEVTSIEADGLIVIGALEPDAAQSSLRGALRTRWQH